jgi:DNA repair protein REV1
MELPEEIRNELKDNYDIDLLREPSLPTTQPHPTHQPLNPSVSSTSITNSNTTFKIPEPIDSSPTNFLPDLPNWSQLDPSALLALPSDMQKQVLQSYQSTKTSGSHEQRRIGNPSLLPPPPPSPPSLVRLPSVPIKPTSPSTTANTGRVTKSLHSHRSNAKLNKKKSGNNITLTQIFPQSPKRTTDNGQSTFDDLRTTRAPAPDNGILGDENIAPSIGVLNDDRSTSLNGMNPKDMDIWLQLPKGNDIKIYTAGTHHGQIDRHSARTFGDFSTRARTETDSHQKDRPPS